MDLLEIWSDEAGDTHFRRATIELVERHFAPPSLPIDVSSDLAMTVSNFVVAPPGWDETFHPTPRRQLAIALSGRAVVSVSDGETIELKPGMVVILSDTTGRGHRTLVQGAENAMFLLAGLGDEAL